MALKLLQIPSYVITTRCIKDYTPRPHTVEVRPETYGTSNMGSFQTQRIRVTYVTVNGRFHQVTLKFRVTFLYARI